MSSVLFVAGLGCSIWLAIATVDTIVAMYRREWRFSVRGALILTAVVSVAFGLLVATKACCDIYILPHGGLFRTW
jgi:hypothetical protein